MLSSPGRYLVANDRASLAIRHRWPAVRAASTTNQMSAESQILVLQCSHGSWPLSQEKGLAQVMARVDFRMRFGVLLLLAAALGAQEPVITTIAGADFVYPPHVPALQAPFLGVSGIATGPDRNLYVCDIRLNQVFRLSSEGEVTVAAGNGIFGASGDSGLAINTMLAYPSSLAFDRDGNMYVSTGSTVRKIDTKGISSKLAGNGSQEYDGDEKPATAAGIDPGPLAIDTEGNIYIVDSYNNRLRRVDPAGIIHTIPGVGDGIHYDSNEDVRLVAVDSVGNIYYKNQYSAIRRVRKDNGAVEFFAGAVGFLGEPFQGADALKVNIDAIAMLVDTDDSLIVATNNALLRIDQTRRVMVLSRFDGDMTANNAGRTPLTSGPIDLVNFDFEAIALDSARNIIVGSYDQRIRRINLASSKYELIAGSGNGQFSGDGGPALYANLYVPGSVSPDSAGNLFIADFGNHRLRKIGSDGLIMTVAGNGSGFGDGPNTGVSATDTAVWPSIVRTDSLGRAHMLMGRSFAGRGDWVVRLENGRLTNLLDPALGYNAKSLAVSAGGEVFVSGTADKYTWAYENQISKLGPDGKPIPVAGVNDASPGAAGGFSGDGQPAMATRILAGAIAFASDGTIVFIDFADEGSGRIRRFIPGGTISTIAGAGTARPGEGVPARDALLPDLRYEALTTDRFGSVYFSYGRGVYRFGHDGILHVVVAESRGGPFAGEGGPARLATLAGYPGDLATDAAGNLYIADRSADRIRVVLANAPQIRVDRTSLTFTGLFTGAPTDPQKLKVSADVSGLGFTVDSDAPWLTMTPASGGSPRLIEVRADPSLVRSAGEFDGRVIVRSENGSPHELVVQVHFSVGAEQPPHLTLNPDLLSYTYSVNGAGRPQLLTVSNTGGGLLKVTVSASTQTGGEWLRLGSTGGSVKAGIPLQILVTADPSKLARSTYRGQILVTGSDGSSITTLVVMSITDSPKTMLLSQTGLSFLSVAGGGIVPPQEFSVLSLGTGDVSFTASPVPPVGTPTWLSPQADSTTARSGGGAARVQVFVKQKDLEPGSYYGQVLIDASGTANSPQTVTLNLRVLDAKAPPPPAVIQPAELTFRPTSNDPPPSQTLIVYNLGVAPVRFRLGAPDSLYVLPHDAIVDPGSPYPVVLQPAYGLGVDSASVTFSFSDGTVEEVPYKVINGPPTPAGTAFSPRDADDGCPRSLNLSVRYIGQTGFLQAGWPAGMGLEVRDNCGNPLTDGAVTAKFSNGDSAVSLTHVGAGIWQGTWASSPGASHVRISFHAEDANHLVAADRDYETDQTDLTNGDTPPSVQARDVVSYSSPSANAPLAPGSLITFTGTNLTSGNTYSPASPPLKIRFEGLAVVLRDRSLPLLYASPTRVDAMIPFGIDPNVPQQLQIQVGNSQSTPLYLNLAEAAPVILAGPDGHANAINIGQDVSTANTPATPARPGDTVVFYGIGLGAVDQPPVSGEAAPVAPMATTTNPVVVQIGEKTSSSTAILTPGFVGLYQFAVPIPAEVATGDAVPVTITVAGQVSRVAYLSVRSAN
jgi:uncharacterized protein (TIGR03437 family)